MVHDFTPNQQQEVLQQIYIIAKLIYTFGFHGKKRTIHFNFSSSIHWLIGALKGQQDNFNYVKKKKKNPTWCLLAQVLQDGKGVDYWKETDINICTCII